jgi:hypothetical protein
VKLANVADKVLNRLLPKVDAAAAACGYCAVKTATCEGGRIYEYLYRLNASTSGRCTTWGAFCSKRRTPEAC